MKKIRKNAGKSVKTRLLNLMKETGYKYMYLLARYFNERLLYKVSVSQYKDNFVLKGGSLLYALNGLETRPTIDVDFMADRISRDREYLENVFREILSIPCDEDGVIFDVETLKSEPITVDEQYPGTRFLVTAHMDSIVYPMSMDIGFGDVITPCPEAVDYPLLLQDMPSINIQAYSLETVIAEKFHAMIDRDVLNSRMKDFFDCYQILTTRELSDEILYEAINATFNNRQLEMKTDLKLFTEDFATDEMRQKQWKSFLKRIQWKQDVDFKEVMILIASRLKPMYDKYCTSYLTHIQKE
jgi:predicted nucleotidyltransferase component of viral defense system